MIDIRPRIVIVEPEKDVQRGYSLILSSNNNYNVVNTYATLDEACKNVRFDYPDVIITDIDPLGSNTIESLRKLKKLDRKTHILVNSSHETSEMIFESLNAGASGYIIKASGYTELLSAVNEVLNNGAPMSPRVAKIVISSFRLNPHSPLSNRETEILQLLSMGKTYKIVANELNIGLETVKSHVKNIYFKLQASNKSNAIEIAKRNSFI
ncbi:MAG: response regulator transcription factor [Bacteroidota bacterium]